MDLVAQTSSRTPHTSRVPVSTLISECLNVVLGRCIPLGEGVASNKFYVLPEGDNREEHLIQQTARERNSGEEGVGWRISRDADLDAGDTQHGAGGQPMGPERWAQHMEFFGGRSIPMA